VRGNLDLALEQGKELCQDTYSSKLNKACLLLWKNWAEPSRVATLDKHHECSFVKRTSLWGRRKACGNEIATDPTLLHLSSSSPHLKFVNTRAYMCVSVSCKHGTEFFRKTW